MSHERTLVCTGVHKTPESCVTRETLCASLYPPPGTALHAPVPPELHLKGAAPSRHPQVRYVPPLPAPLGALRASPSRTPRCVTCLAFPHLEVRYVPPLPAPPGALRASLFRHPRVRYMLPLFCHPRCITCPPPSPGAAFPA